MTTKKQLALRGAASDKLGEVLSLLGLELTDEMDGDGWCSPAIDAINALKQAAKVEGIIAGGAAEAPAVDEAAASVEARMRFVSETGTIAKDASLNAPARRAAARTLRAIHGMRDSSGVSPEEAQAAADALLKWGQDVLGKPEATMAEVLAELDARKEEVGKVLGTDTPPPPPEGEGAVTKAAAEDPKKPAAEAPPTPELEKKKEEDAKAALRERDDKIAQHEAREWVREELERRNLDREFGGRQPVTKTEREDLVADVVRSGRGIVSKLLDARNTPPTGNPLDGKPEPAAAPKSYADAAREGGPIWLEAEAIERRRDPNVPKHVITGRMNRLIEQAYPGLVRAH